MVNLSEEHPYCVLWRIDLYRRFFLPRYSIDRVSSPFARPKTSGSRSDEFGWLSELRVVSCRKSYPILSTAF